MGAAVFTATVAITLLWKECAGFALPVRPTHRAIRFFHGGHTRLTMAYDTIVKCQSEFEARCATQHDPGFSLENYMKLPVDQYVCIKMPLDATLIRIKGNTFNLTVPPVQFFNLAVSPTIMCEVTQDAQSVIIESDSVLLSGSKYVVGLNGCYKIKIKTVFSWVDEGSEKNAKKVILSASSILVEVEPPAPFKYFSKRILESTGTLALSIALRQIENAFVTSLARDYERWALDAAYREVRANSCPCVETANGASCDIDGVMDTTVTRNAVVADDFASAADAANNADASFASLPSTAGEPQDTSTPAPIPAPNFQLASAVDFFNSVNNDPSAEDEGPAVLTDDICLVPGDPVVRIEEAPSNARRIFTGVDIAARVENVWDVLVDYEHLDEVIPSLVKNKVIKPLPNGGARLAQVGGAKVLPGVTFTAKIVLDVNLYLEKSPLPQSMQASQLSATATSSDVRAYDKMLPLVRGVFPRPYALTRLPFRDITMQNVEGEGDFEHYQGIWRMQSLPNCAPDGGDACRLSYAVELRPKGLLPVRLIEGRIASDLKANLAAIRQVVEKRASENVGASVRSGSNKGAAAVLTSSNIGGLRSTGVAVGVVVEDEDVEAVVPFDAMEGLSKVLGAIRSTTAESDMPEEGLADSEGERLGLGLGLEEGLADSEGARAIASALTGAEDASGEDDGMSIFSKIVSPSRWFKSSTKTEDATVRENRALQAKVIELEREMALLKGQKE